MTILNIKHPSRLALSGKSGWACFILHSEEHPYLLLHSLYAVNDIYALRQRLPVLGQPCALQIVYSLPADRHEVCTDSIDAYIFRSSIYYLTSSLFCAIT